MLSLITRLYPTLYDPTGCSWPGSSVHGDSTIPAGNCTPECLFQKKNSLMFTQNLHINVYRSFICVAKIQKQLKCPSMDEWLNRLCNLHTMEFYLVLKRNRILGHPGLICRKLCWAEKNQFKKATKHMIPFI